MFSNKLVFFVIKVAIVCCIIATHKSLNFKVVENQSLKEFFDLIFLMLETFKLFNFFRLRSCWLCYKTVEKLQFKNLHFLVAAPFFLNSYPSDLFLGMLLTFYEHHKLTRQQWTFLTKSTHPYRNRYSFPLSSFAILKEFLNPCLLQLFQWGCTLCNK